MAGERRLHLYWDPELDGDFRQRLDHALRGLRVNAVDASGVDPDPDARAVVVALVSASGGGPLPPRPDIVVLAGPGDFRSSGDALRLEADDIANGSRRWLRFVDQLRAKLAQPSLALAPEDLEVRLDEAARRADAAERARDQLERERNEALRAASRLEADLVGARSRAETLEQQLDQLAAIHQLSAFAITSVDPRQREVVAEAREHAWRARLAAQRAAEMASLHPDVLVWGKSAIYSGESQNFRPHGYGVMTFLGGRRDPVASYRGVFDAGGRAGHGVGASADGLVWTGQWFGDEAHGLGILEAPDGQRFEGEVAPDSDGAPRQVRGWTWEPSVEPTTLSSREVETRHAVPPALPSPHAVRR
jgi:hypothetical protein